MTDSILAESATTTKMESNDVSPSSEKATAVLTELDELISHLEQFKEEAIYDTPRREEAIYDTPRPIESYTEEPIYDTPRPIEAYRTDLIYDIPRSAISNFDIPRPSGTIYDTPRPIGAVPIYDIPRTEAKRPLPPLPVESLMDKNSIYETVSEFRAPKDSSATKRSFYQAKIHFINKRLQRCLHSLNKILSTMRSKSSNDAVKTLQNMTHADPVMDEKIMHDLADFKVSRYHIENIQAFMQNLEGVIFVLEGKVANFDKVYASEYGGRLGVELTWPMAQAKSDLRQARTHLTALLEMEPTLRKESESTQAPVSAANNRFTLFGKTASTTAKMEENTLYESVDVVKGMSRSV